MKLDPLFVSEASGIAEPFVAHWEAFRAQPYLDAVGIPTIGFGFTHYADGSRVAMTDPAMTLQSAADLLKTLLEQAANQIETFLTRQPTLHQMAAMLSLCYNIGAYGFDHSSVLREFDQDDIEGSADSFLMWDKGKNKHGALVEIDGLKNRREAERLLFLTADL